MCTKSNNIEIMMGNETDEIIEELFDLFCKIIEKGKKKWDDLLHYNLHKISLNRGGSYIDSPKWLKNKTETINPENNDDKCFQYALTVDKLKTIHNEYQKLNLLLISIIGKK